MKRVAPWPPGESSPRRDKRPRLDLDPGLFLPLECLCMIMASDACDYGTLCSFWSCSEAMRTLARRELTRRVRATMPEGIWPDGDMLSYTALFKWLARDMLETARLIARVRHPTDFRVCLIGRHRQFVEVMAVWLFTRPVYECGTGWVDDAGGIVRGPCEPISGTPSMYRLAKMAFNHFGADGLPTLAYAMDTGDSTKRSCIPVDDSMLFMYSWPTWTRAKTQEPDETSPLLTILVTDVLMHILADPVCGLSHQHVLLFGACSRACKDLAAAAMDRRIRQQHPNIVFPPAPMPSYTQVFKTTLLGMVPKSLMYTPVYPYACLGIEVDPLDRVYCNLVWRDIASCESSEDDDSDDSDYDPFAKEAIWTYDTSSVKWVPGPAHTPSDLESDAAFDHAAAVHVALRALAKHGLVTAMVLDTAADPGPSLVITLIEYWKDRGQWI